MTETISDIFDVFHRLRVDVRSRGALGGALSFAVREVLRARWIVSLPHEGSPGGEMGLRVGGVNLWYYKWGDPMVANGIPWRFANKREFGEVVRSVETRRDAVA